MSATLGGLIKDLRIQKNISQLEIAFALGWKEPSRLSRIEQGRNTAPPRFLIENIMDAMKLSDEEKHQLFVVGNYILTEEEIEEAKKTIVPMIENWKFPAFAMDYTWRIIACNKKLYTFFNISIERQQVIETTHPNLLELAFNDFLNNQLETTKEEASRNSYLYTMIVQFIDSHRGRTRERWYQELLKKMMDNKLFRELWTKALILPAKNNSCEFMNFGDLTFYISEKEKRVPLNLHFFDAKLFRDDRFYVEFYTPSDLETFQYFNK